MQRVLLFYLMLLSQEQIATIEQIERLIRRDPARRGLLSKSDVDDLLPVGRLAQAASDLAARARRTWIVTGFYIPRANPPAAESDGPLGALLLARILHSLDLPVEIITDPFCAPLLRETVRSSRLSETTVREIPDRDLSRLIENVPSDLTHLVSIERVGPSHTLNSLISQPRSVEPPLYEFERSVPISARDHCYNMRGDIIDSYTGSLHQLFELLPHALPNLRTIGIGDGGNEIGMGTIPWEVVCSRLPHSTPPRSVCRISTDWNLIAGTSNWGGYALAASVAFLRHRTDLLSPFTADQQFNVLKRLVDARLAVDGVTLEYQPTVDGLPFLAYIQPWTSIRLLLGLDQ